MKLIPIYDVRVLVDDSEWVALIDSAPNKTTYKDLFCRLTFEQKDTFVNPDIIARTTFNDPYLIVSGFGIPFGHLDSLELENYEQISNFSMKANEALEMYVWCQFFEKVEL